MNAITDKIKQIKMRQYYDGSDYYEKNRNNFADIKNRYKKNMEKNIFSLYYPRKGEKIIDLGCGWGNNSLSLQKKGFDVIGLDYSFKAIKICMESALKLGLDPSRFVCQDATKTQFKAAIFDVAYCVDFVEHIYPTVYNDLLSEVHRILKKDGKFIIYTPNPSHFIEFLKRHDIILKKVPTHVDYKTMDRLKTTLTEHGFIIKKAIYMETHYPVLEIIEKRLLHLIPFFRRRNGVLAIKIG